MNTMRSVTLFIAISCLCAQVATGEGLQKQIDELFRKRAGKLAELPTLEAKKAREMIGNPSYLFIDARKEKEQAVSMIPGAVTWEEFQHAEDAKYRGRALIVYCTVGVRSGRVVKLLQSDGHQAFNLKGGVLSWAHAGGSFADADGAPTSRVHVYSRRFDLLPSGYEAEH